MKRITISTLILLVLLGTAVYGQTALDKKNGFKDFTLGDPYTKWVTSLTYIKTLPTGVAIYKYIGICCQQVFNYNIEEIRLGFENNKLKVIWFSTEKFQKGFNGDGKYTQWNGTKDFDKLKDNLTYLFDKPTTFHNDEKTGEIKYIWGGEKVILTLEYDYLGIMEGDRCNILVGVLDDSQLKSGF